VAFVCLVKVGIERDTIVSLYKSALNALSTFALTYRLSFSSAALICLIAAFTRISSSALP
jgi:hypothetical protein